MKIFAENLILLKVSTESEFFLEIGGNLKQASMHHCLRGNGRPSLRHQLS